MHCVVFGMLKNLCVPEHSQGKYNVTKENVKKKITNTGTCHI
jgi:hypothetical protein